MYQKICRVAPDRSYRVTPDAIARQQELALARYGHTRYFSDFCKRGHRCTPSPRHTISDIIHKLGKHIQSLELGMLGIAACEREIEALNFKTHAWHEPIAHARQTHLDATQEIARLYSLKNRIEKNIAPIVQAAELVSEVRKRFQELSLRLRGAHVFHEDYAALSKLRTHLQQDHPRSIVAQRVARDSARLLDQMERMRKQIPGLCA